MLANGVSAMRLFALGLATPAAAGNQFQLGDTGPRGSLDTNIDGEAIVSADVTIARLYSLGLLPPTAEGVPTVPTMTGNEESQRPDGGPANRQRLGQPNRHRPHRPAIKGR